MPRDDEWLFGSLAAQDAYPPSPWEIGRRVAAGEEPLPQAPERVRRDQLTGRDPYAGLATMGGRGVMGSIADVGQRASDMLREAGEAAGRTTYAQTYGGIAPEVPGQWSEVDEFRRQQLLKARYQQGIHTAYGMTFDPFRAVGGMSAPGSNTLVTAGAGSKIVQPSRPGGVADQAAYPGARFPQYATEYPPVGPPVPKLKDKPKFEGETYPAKQLTPEAKLFEKERSRIMKDMERTGYTPYFDPAARFDVDPKYYPQNVNTLDVVPKKPEVLQKHLDAIGADETRKRLQDAYAKGVELGGTGPRLTTQDWYMMGQLEQELVRTMGAKAGREAFRERFATPMAATTGGMDPRSNLLAAGYYNFLGSRGERWPVANQWPYPVGARYGEQLSGVAQKIADEGGFQALDLGHPKRHNFASNFMGHRKPGTMDEQMTMGMQGKRVPDWYGVNERVVAEEAAKIGVDPRKFQETSWHGVKGIGGTPMIAEVNAAIERTHRLTGMPRSEIVRRAWGVGDIPLYGVPAALTMGALADQSRFRGE